MAVLIFKIPLPTRPCPRGRRTDRALAERLLARFPHFETRGDVYRAPIVWMQPLGMATASVLGDVE